MEERQMMTEGGERRVIIKGWRKAGSMKFKLYNCMERVRTKRGRREDKDGRESSSLSNNSKQKWQQ